MLLETTEMKELGGDCATEDMLLGVKDGDNTGLAALASEPETEADSELPSSSS